MLRRRWLATVCGVAMIAAACGGANGPASDGNGAGNGNGGADDPGEPEGDHHPIFTYQGDDREERLLEGALEEGRLVWYTAVVGPVATALANGFEDAYPGVTVEVLRDGQPALITRMLQEIGAGRPGPDVVEMPAEGAILVHSLDLSVPRYSPHTDEIPDRWKIVNDEGLVYVSSIRASYGSFAYNTELLDEADVPRELEDLANPALAGMGMPDATGVRIIGSILFKYGEERGREILEAMGENGVEVQAVSGATVADMVARGELAAAFGVFQPHAETLQAEGAPIAWVPLNPVLGNIGSALVTELGQSPHAAVLFADFLTGPEGRAVLEELNYPPPALEVDFEVWVPNEAYESILDYEEDFQLWAEILDGF